MSNKKLIVANWKMNKGLIESQKFAEEIRTYVEKHGSHNCDIVICPPFTSIDAVHKKLNNSSISVGAQNVFYETTGAYTGEISCSMLKSCGCEYVIVGHSERRQYFHETNEIVNKKVLKVLDEGLNAIICIGETLAEHEDRITEAVIGEQLDVCLQHVTEDQIHKVVIAYEPVWAIGTGKNATPHQAETVHNFIRKKIRKLYNDEDSRNIRIIYGGSISPENCKELFLPQTISGGLVGGASLKENKFIEIINSVN